MQALLDVVLPVFLVIGAGYLLARLNLVEAIHIDGLMEFAQHFAIPCLLFTAISRLDLSAGFQTGLLFSFYLGATICFVVGMLGAHYLFGREWEDSVVIGFICLFSNSVLQGLPITERAYGPDALAGNYAIAALHAPFCYGLGVTVMEIVRHRGRDGRAVVRAVLSATLRNVLLLAIALGYAANISGLHPPAAISDALDLVARAGLPCALVALGGVLSRYRPEGDLRVVLWATGISLILHPAITWTLGTATGINRDAFRSAVLTAAMAPGINAYIFAGMYGRATRVAASAVLMATTVSVLTIWVWLALLP